MLFAKRILNFKKIKPHLLNTMASHLKKNKKLEEEFKINGNLLKKETIDYSIGDISNKRKGVY